MKMLEDGTWRVDVALDDATYHGNGSTQEEARASLWRSVQKAAADLHSAIIKAKGKQVVLDAWLDRNEVTLKAHVVAANTYDPENKVPYEFAKAKQDVLVYAARKLSMEPIVATGRYWTEVAVECNDTSFFNLLSELQRLECTDLRIYAKSDTVRDAVESGLYGKFTFCPCEWKAKNTP